MLVADFRNHVGDLSGERRLHTGIVDEDIDRTDAAFSSCNALIDGRLLRHIKNRRMG